MIFERDKERGRRRGLWTTSRTSDAVSFKKRPAPEGKPLFCPTDCVAPPRRVPENTPSSSRLAFGQNRGFQSSYYLRKGQ